MKPKSGSRACFPFYLKPEPDPELLKWVGEHLQKVRAKKTAAHVAKAAKVTTEEIERIEQGIILHSLGCFRQILQWGYGCSLEDILATCFETFKERFNPKGSRHFERASHYSFCPPDKQGNHRTPLFIGGDLDSFLWAVPLRTLKMQPLSMDLLELVQPESEKFVEFRKLLMMALRLSMSCMERFKCILRVNQRGDIVER